MQEYQIDLNTFTCYFVSDKEERKKAGLKWRENKKNCCWLWRFVTFSWLCYWWYWCISELLVLVVRLQVAMEKKKTFSRPINHRKLKTKNAKGKYSKFSCYSIRLKSACFVLKVTSIDLKVNPSPSPTPYHSIPFHTIYMQFGW